MPKRPLTTAVALLVAGVIGYLLLLVAVVLIFREEGRDARREANPPG